MERYVKTLCLMMVWISTGMNIEITGPTLIDLKLRLNSTVTEVARSVAGRGVGDFLGAVIGGVLVDKFSNWNDLNVAVLQAAIASAVLAIPFIKDTTLLWFIFFINGVCHGATNVSGQRIILEMWQEKAAGQMHMLHIGYGIGAIVVPIIANPFLAEIYNTTQSNISNNDSDTFFVRKESEIQYAYLIVAVFNYLLVFPFVIFQIFTFIKNTRNTGERQGKKTSKSFKKILNPATYANGSFCYGLLMLILLFLFFFSLVGDTNILSNFVRSFSVDQLNFSKTTASYLNMAYWASFTLGRFFGFIAAAYISMTYLFFTEVTISVVTIFMFLMFSTKGVIQFWVTVLIVGLSLGPLTPSCIAYCNTKIEITGMCLMILTLAGGTGQSAFTWIAGIFYDSNGPSSLLYILQAGGSFYFAVMLIMVLSSRSRPNRFIVERSIQNENKYAQNDPLITSPSRIN